jgi:hypothetical protein
MIWRSSPVIYLKNPLIEGFLGSERRKERRNAASN